MKNHYYYIFLAIFSVCSTYSNPQRVRKLVSAARIINRARKSPGARLAARAVAEVVVNSEKRGPNLSKAVVPVLPEQGAQQEVISQRKRFGKNNRQRYVESLGNFGKTVGKKLADSYVRQQRSEFRWKAIKRTAVVLTAVPMVWLVWMKVLAC